MKSKTSRNVIFSLLAIMAVGYFMNMMILLPHHRVHGFISPSNVKGVTVYHQDKPYPLNEQQQVQVLTLFNRGSRVKEIQSTTFTEKSAHPQINKIVIHCDNGSNIDLFPIGFIETKMVFLVVGWEKPIFLIETDTGQLENLLKKTFI